MSDTSNSGGSPGSSSGRGGGSGSDSSSSGTRETGSQSLFTTTDTAPNAINDVQNTSSASEPLKVVFVLGGPGAGKSTICKHVVGSLNETSSDSRDHYCHLSAGDHLRYLAHVGSGGGCAASGGQCVSEQGHDQEQLPAEAYAGLSPAEMLGTMQRSELMRSDKIVDILCWKLGDIQKQAVSAGEIDNSSSVAFVVDGFPRTLESAELWEDKVGKPAMVLLVHSSRTTAETRFLSRGRETEDTAEKHAKRFDQFLSESGPILELYMAQGLMVEVDNENDLDDTVAEVVGHVRAAMRVCAQT